MVFHLMMLTCCGQNLPNTQITTVIPKSEWEKIKRIIYPEGSRAPINAKIKDLGKRIAEYGGFIIGSKRRPGVSALNHPFIDGNKRVAFFSVDTFLRMNGYCINCNNQKAYDYFMELFDSQKFRFAALALWLFEHVDKL